MNIDPRDLSLLLAWFSVFLKLLSQTLSPWLVTHGNKEISRVISTGMLRMVKLAKKVRDDGVLPSIVSL